MYKGSGRPPRKADRVLLQELTQGGVVVPGAVVDEARLWIVLAARVAVALDKRALGTRAEARVVIVRSYRPRRSLCPFERINAEPA